jgi:hypothetical protein
VRKWLEALALAGMLANAGGAFAHISALNAAKANEGGTVPSIDEPSPIALPRESARFMSIHRDKATRYVPSTLGPWLKFAANTQSATDANGRNTPFTAGDKSARGPAREGGKPVATRPAIPVRATSTTAPGQSGYVHFFLLETPEGETETLVGIELPDGRIAWSFPELGVSVAAFIRSGQLEVNGRIYSVQHLYGLRPFPDEAVMRTLRRQLEDRVVRWVDSETPYCNSTTRPDHFCLSCLGFALQILFPGRTPAYPALPADFPRTASLSYYTTDDLLLYLTGLHLIPDRTARLARLNELNLPNALREDLLALASVTDLGAGPEGNRADDSKSFSEKKRSGTRSYSRTPAQRKRL